MLEIAAAIALASASAGGHLGGCHHVRGKMFLANGTPGVRIWVVGTRRVLGVTQQDESLEKLPQNIRDAWHDRNGARDGGVDLYGDFEVCPLAAQHAGRMQPVWVRSSRNLVARSTYSDGMAVSPPTTTDFDIARTNHVHEATGLGGMAHCLRFTDFRCTRSMQAEGEFRCTYREWTKRGPWTRKTAVLRKDGPDWRWGSGDAPKCSIMLTN